MHLLSGRRGLCINYELTWSLSRISAALRPLRGKSLTAHAVSLIESNRINVHASLNPVLNPLTHPLDSIGIIAYDGYIRSNRHINNRIARRMNRAVTWMQKRQGQVSNQKWLRTVYAACVGLRPEELRTAKQIQASACICRRIDANRKPGQRGHAAGYGIGG